MKKIEAIIKPVKLWDVKTSLAQLGVNGMTVTEVKGCGHERGRAEFYQGSEYTVDFLPKLKIDFVVTDSEVEAAVNAIANAANTGTIGDGKILVFPVDEVVRIRTREKGERGLDSTRYKNPPEPLDMNLPPGTMGRALANTRETPRRVETNTKP
jgi:nitrogen regulatory protein P-II 1